MLLIGGEAVLESFNGAEYYFPSPEGNKQQRDFKLKLEGVTLYTASTSVASREDIIFWKLLGGTSTGWKLNFVIILNIIYRTRGSTTNYIR